MQKNFNKPKNYAGHRNFPKILHKREVIDEDDDEDPSWLDFEPSTAQGAFVGRVMNDENSLREQVQQDKLNLKGKMQKDEEVDLIEELMREEQERKRAEAQIDNEEEEQINMISQTIEEDENLKYSNIDLIMQRKLSRFEQSQLKKKVDDKQQEELFEDL